MKILLLVAGGWISFMNQGYGLKSALTKIGIKTDLILAGTSPSDTSHPPDLTGYKDYIIITIGSWQDYGRLIDPALKTKCRVIPWIVSDAQVDFQIVQKLNELPFFLTTSEYCKSIFIRDGINADKVYVLYEAVDEDIWKPIPIEQENAFLDYVSIDEENLMSMPVSFNLNKVKRDKTPVLLTVGGDATSKGALEIISALHNLDTNIPWVWVIKTLPYEYSFQCSAKEYSLLGNLTPRIKYITGEFSSRFLIELMNLCDIYIAVSRGEGFGLPLVEAQMCGKMVITHNSTSTVETIVEGKTGLLAQSQIINLGDDKGSARADIGSLTQTLHEALTNKILRQELSAQARPTAIERFGKQAIANHLLSYIDKFRT